MEAGFSQTTRASALLAMSAEPVELLVLGGGITGAGIARDAALRRYQDRRSSRQGRFRRRDISRSSRLIHGGLRYLEHGISFWSSRDARAGVLLRSRPIWSVPSRFLFPYTGARASRRGSGAGMWLYDSAAVFRSAPAPLAEPQARTRLEPRLRTKGLQGAALYYDAQADDVRLVLATIRSAAQAGALVANYADASSLLKSDGHVHGATIRDALSDRTYSVRALVVVNATGPWVDAVRERDDPHAQPLLRLTKGAHVAVHERALGTPTPSRSRRDRWPGDVRAPWGD